jgi:hypothetical protein
MLNRGKLLERSFSHKKLVSATSSHTHSGKAVLLEMFELMQRSSGTMMTLSDTGQVLAADLALKEGRHLRDLPARKGRMRFLAISFENLSKRNKFFWMLLISETRMPPRRMMHLIAEIVEMPRIYTVGYEPSRKI